MIGKECARDDDYRADFVKKIRDMGKLSQLTLSLDICRKEQLRTNGGYGYFHLFETFIPMLKKRGITDDDLEIMLKNNPRRLLKP